MDQDVQDYTMDWANEAESSYEKVTVKKEPKKTTFTFYADRLSPISEGETAELGLFLKGSPKSVTLKAYLNKRKLSGSSVTWKTSNKKVATVKNGKVSAVSKGIVTIEAAKDGLTARCRVKVKKPTISLNSKLVTIYDKIATQTKLSATVNGVKVSGNKVKCRY